MAGDRVSIIVNLVTNAMIAVGAALLLIGLIGLMLTRMDDERRGGMNRDDADH
jgi:hypothetical protein